MAEPLRDTGCAVNTGAAVRGGAQAAPHPLSRLSLVIDVVTRACNMHCAYCHERAETGPAGHDLDARANSAEWLLRQTAQRRITWLLHGGEPLFAGLTHLERIWESTEILARRLDKQLSWGIQTNGTLIDDTTARWLAARRFRVSVSLDGPAAWNDGYRGQGVTVEAAIARLQRAGIRPAVLCVLTRANAGHIDELVAYFRGLGVASVRYNPCWPVGRADDAVVADAAVWVDAKTALLDRMIAEEDPRADRELAHWACLRLLPRRNGARSGICASRPCGAGRRVVAIGPAGALYACGRALDLPGEAGLLAGAGRWPSARAWRARLRAFHAPQRPKPGCAACPAFGWCTAGCPSFLWQRPDLADCACRFWKGMAAAIDARDGALTRVLSGNTGGTGAPG